MLAAVQTEPSFNLIAEDNAESGSARPRCSEESNANVIGASGAGSLCN